MSRTTLVLALLALSCPSCTRSAAAPAPAPVSVPVSVALAVPVPVPEPAPARASAPEPAPAPAPERRPTFRFTLERHELALADGTPGNAIDRRPLERAEVEARVLHYRAVPIEVLAEKEPAPLTDSQLLSAVEEWNRQLGGAAERRSIPLYYERIVVEALEP